MDKEKNKKIKLVYRDHVLIPKSRYFHEVYTKRVEIEWNVIGGKSTGLSDLGRNKTREDVLEFDSNPAKKSGAIQVLGKAAWAGAAIVVKYFVIVDILINFMGKINITLSPLIGKYVDNI